MIKVIPISEARAQLTQLIKRVQREGEPVIITQRSRAVALLVDQDSYEKLIDRVHELEELEDLRDIASAQKEYSAEQAVEYNTYRSRRLRKNVSS